MKTVSFIAGAVFFVSGCINGFSQAAFMHQFNGITVSAERTVSLSVTGAIPVSFRNYYDLFPIEASGNLLDWTPLVTLFRTNRATNIVAYLDLAATNYNQRFYRTPTNQLFTPIPPPDGPYRVGKFSRLVTDASRTNRYAPTNSSFMVTVWYPAQPVAGLLPAPYTEPQITALGGAYCVPANHAEMRGHALPGALLATNETKYPLVLYTHGHQSTRTDNTRKVENLVSFGFIVVGLDNIDCYGTVFPNGKLFRGLQAPNLGPGDPTTQFIATNRFQDVRFLLDEAARWNATDPLLNGRLDLNRVGIFGHSFGGGTSYAACAQEPRVKAGLSLDGGWPWMPFAVFDRPFMILPGGDNDDYMQQFRDAYRSLYDRLAQDAYWVHLKNSSHCDLNETPWFETPTSTTLIRRALVQDLYIVSFFRKYLRLEDDHFLDGPPAQWPEVDVFLKK